MHFELIIKYLRTVTTIITILLLFVLLDLLFPLPEQKQYSKEILANDGTLLSAYLTEDDKWRFKTELEEISPELIKAIIEKEDSWFYWHLGVNPISIVRALYKNFISGERVSGASTITMQVARMLEPKERTYLNKFIEMFRALQIELRYSKNEILEMYLSLLPFGGNIEGVKSASYIYFNRPPDKLSLAQSVLLAVIPNNPNSLRLDRINDEIIIRRNYWINKFRNENVFSLNELDDAFEEPVEPNRFKIPTLAPHFSYYVKENFKEYKIKTTLDLSIQQTAENLLLRQVKAVFYKGITNGAVLVIDNKNSSVVAYCGSADFYDDGSFGQVNGITAIRSPGSTLKPALYEYAFDNGTLTPQMKLADIPTDFNGYQPENYDLKFYGNISARFALVNSLNIPAVSLLRRSGLNNFTNFLEGCGFSEIRKQKGKLGLSLILGGCGSTLEELTRLFSAFASKGSLHPLVYRVNELANKKSVKVFSSASSFLIAEILSGMNRNDIADLKNYSKLPKFAWKTGTSYGKRDAWAIGFNPNYTIGVWMGNFNGRGSPHLSGAEVAVPLLFDLFNTIDYDTDEKWFDFPDELYKRKVCSESGLLPTKFCSNVIDDFAIEDKSHNEVCNIHNPVYVNLDETIQYCTECLPANNYKKVVYNIYQPELTVWFTENNYNITSPPQHNHNCNAKFSEKGPRILSPTEDYEYFVEENSEQEIVLLAASDGKVNTHYWFVNDEYFGKTKPGNKIFLIPETEELKITCLDDKGRDESVMISVKYY
ncbi:MAG: penicillin-binding protein 1C [Ignavibacterium sp.]|nr:MAG: penicillin-binding protein 1C [Ignavibacterium sp.]